MAPRTCKSALGREPSSAWDVGNKVGPRAGTAGCKGRIGGGGVASATAEEVVGKVSRSLLGREDRSGSSSGILYLILRISIAFQSRNKRCTGLVLVNSFT